VRGLITYNEQVLEGNKKVQSALNTFPYSELDGDAIAQTKAGVEQSRNSWQDQKNVWDSLQRTMPIPVLSQTYGAMSSFCMGQIMNCEGIIRELNKQLQALQQFANQVSGAYSDAQSTKGTLQTAFKSLGNNGSNTYVNGEFSITGMSYWANALIDDCRKEQNHIIDILISELGISKEGGSANKNNGNFGTAIDIEKLISSLGVPTAPKQIVEVLTGIVNSKIWEYIVDAEGAHGGLGTAFKLFKGTGGKIFTAIPIISVLLDYNLENEKNGSNPEGQAKTNLEVGAHTISNLGIDTLTADGGGILFPVVSVGEIYIDSKEDGLVDDVFTLGHFVDDNVKKVVSNAFSGVNAPENDNQIAGDWIGWLWGKASGKN
jgi:hypothetical protein